METVLRILLMSKKALLGPCKEPPLYLPCTNGLATQAVQARGSQDALQPLPRRAAPAHMSGPLEFPQKIVDDEHVNSLGDGV